jgi:hypothetical protein
MTTAELRKFGLVTGAIIIGFIGMFLPWLKGGIDKMLHWLPYASMVGGVLIVWALIHADSLVYVHKPWMLFAEKLGWVNTRIIMSVFFYVILTPIGFIMSLTGKDPMARRFDSSAPSYRIRKEPQTKDHMETPF